MPNDKPAGEGEDYILDEAEKVPAPVNTRKRIPKKLLPFVASLGIHAAIGGALVGAGGFALNYGGATTKNMPGLSDAKPKDTTTSKVSKNPFLSKVPLNTIDVQKLSEPDFEEVVESAVRYYESRSDSKEKAQLLLELADFYNRRMYAYAEVLFEDMKDGKFDGDYLEFLSKTAAYNKSLTAFLTGDTHFERATRIRDTFLTKISDLRGNLTGQLDGKSIGEQVDVVQGALIEHGVIKKRVPGSTRFDHMALHGEGNCASMSDVSMLAIERLISIPQGAHFAYRSYLGHIKTVLTDKDGSQTLYENNSVENKGVPIPNNDPGLTVPKDIRVVTYLMKHGRKLDEFHADSQKFFNNDTGKGTGGGTTDSVYGDLPNRGYCEDGSTQCVDTDETEIDFTALQQQALQKKFHGIDTMSLGEIIDSGFFVIEGGGATSKEAGGLIVRRFYVDQDVLIQKINERIRRGEVAQLNSFQLRRLGQAIRYSSPDQFNGREAIFDQIRTVGKPKMIHDLVEMARPGSERRFFAGLATYVDTYKDLPVELAQALTGISNIQAREKDYIPILGRVENISKESFRTLCTTSLKRIRLGLNKIPADLGEDIHRAFSGAVPIDIELPYIGIKTDEDADNLFKIISSFDVQELIFRGFESAESANRMKSRMKRDYNYNRNKPHFVVQDLAYVNTETVKPLRSASGGFVKIEAPFDTVSDTVLEALLVNDGEDKAYISSSLRYKKSVPKAHRDLLLKNKNTHYVDLNISFTPDNEFLDFIRLYTAGNSRTLKLSFDEINQIPHALFEMAARTNIGIFDILIRGQLANELDLKIAEADDPIVDEKAGIKLDAFKYYARYKRTKPDEAESVAKRPRATATQNGILTSYRDFVTADYATLKNYVPAAKEVRADYGFLHLTAEAAEAFALSPQQEIVVRVYEDFSPETASALIRAASNKTISIISPHTSAEHMRGLRQNEGAINLYLEKDFTKEMLAELKEAQGTINIIISMPISKEIAMLIKNFHNTNNAAIDLIGIDNGVVFTPEAAYILGVDPNITDYHLPQ